MKLIFFRPHLRDLSTEIVLSSDLFPPTNSEMDEKSGIREDTFF